MSKVIILGSSNAIPSAEHENTHMVIIGEERTVLVDCVSSPILRLEKAGLDFNSLTDLIVTHFHPDHVTGVPLLLMDMWLMGRSRALNVYGLRHTLDRLEDLMGFYGWTEWPGFFPVTFHRLPANELTTVLDCPDFRILCSPTRHLVPTIGLRFEFHHRGKVMAYSCDTEPCPEVVRLADGADVLIHEAGGKTRGHSSARQAAEIAAQAEAGKLFLIHYPTGRFSSGDPVADAREHFQGEVRLAEDFMEIELS